MNEAVASELCKLLEEVLSLNRKTYQMAKAMEQTVQRSELLREEYRQQSGRTDTELQCEAVAASLERLRVALHLPG